MSEKKTPKKTANKKVAGKEAATAKPAKGAAAKKAPRKKPAAASASGKGGTRSTRVVIPMGTYSANKDAVKKPLKKEKLKWAYLGPGKGRYVGKDASAFVQYGDDGADFTLTGDAAAVQRILDAWRDALGADTIKEGEAAAEDVAEEEAHEVPPEVLAWRVGRPVRQPGEPESWYAKRLAAWEAGKPEGA